MAVADKVSFPGAHGTDLAARLHMPDGPVRAVALFAHCFTCGKDTVAASRIATGLSDEGYAVLRFDFTGLGGSDGDFANTNFSSNIADLVAASSWLRENIAAPSLLVGHSLGGAAVIAAAGEIPESRAVVTIGAPADTAHVLHNFGGALEEIEAKGETEVELAGRPFTIRKEFVDDVKMHDQDARIANLRKALLVLHAPTDDTVGIDNASRIFTTAKHPKSFISLDGANHLLTDRKEAAFAAGVIAAWALRYVGNAGENAEAAESEDVTVTETGKGKFQQRVRARSHAFVADEPRDVGGLDSGPTPYDLLAAALGACTAMTLRMYADRKKLDLGRVSVTVAHGKVHAKDCAGCAEEIAERGGKVDRFERVITVEGGVAGELRDKILEIADKCPVHRTLESGAAIVSRYEE